MKIMSKIKEKFARPRKPRAAGLAAVKDGRRRIISAGLVCVFAAALAGGALLGAGTADAYTASTKPVNIGSLTLADYDTRTDGNVFDADVLQKLYDKLTGTANSTYAAAYSAVNASSSTITGSVSAGTPALCTNVNAWTQPKSKNFNAINGSSPFTVSFGGFDWNVVYATTNTTAAGTDNLIVTLWMSENASTSVWNSYSSLDCTSPYPSSMYSSSKIRVDALNAGGDAGVNYATSTTARVGTVSGRQSHIFAPFTLSNAVIGGKSLTNYLVSPNKVAYQENENWVWSYMGNGKPYLCPNEAWDTPDTSVVHPSGGSGWAHASYGSGWSDNYLIPNKADYYEWADDTLWLPSLTETGFSADSTSWGVGLWGTLTAYNSVDNILKSSGNTWLRSGTYAYATYCYGLSPSGGSFLDTTTSAAAVRPALHLNLKSAAASAAGAIKKPTPPAANTFTYNRTTQTLDLSTLTNWDSNKMEVISIARDGGTAHTAPTVVAPAGSATATKVEFTDAGTYKIKIRTKDTTVAGATYHWVFEGTPAGTREVEISVTVNKSRLAVPSFGTAAAVRKNYDGTEQTFTASGYPNGNVTGYPRDPLAVTITKTNGAMTVAPTVTATSGSTLEVKTKHCGDYKATFTIADTHNYEWSDGTSAGKDALFYLLPKQLTITATTTVASNVWAWTADATESGTITVGGFYNGGGGAPADSVDLQLAVKNTSDGSVTYIAGTDNHDGTYTFTVNKDIAMFGGSYAVGTYRLEPKLGAGGGGADDGNYSFDTALGLISSDKEGYKLVVSAAGAGLASYDLMYDDGSGLQPMPAGNKVPYKLNAAGTAGVQYTVSLDTSNFPSYLSVDTSYNTGGFVNGYKNSSAINAGSYTVQVHLKSNDPGHQFSDGTLEGNVSVSWEIEKATFDLSGAKWQYSDASGNTNDYAKWNATSGAWEYLDSSGGVIPADAGIPWYGSDYTLSLASLPAGISINPSGAYTGNKQKAINSSYHASCISISYDTVNFNAIPNGFTELNWSIVKGKVEIISGSWTTNSQGSGSNIYYLPTLSHNIPNVQGVDYEYYDLGTDAAPIALPGTLLAGGINDIVSVSGTEHYYYVKAVVKSGFSLDGVTLWSDAIAIVDSTGGDSFQGTPLGACTKKFTTGDNRTPVQVVLNGAPFTYNGQPRAVLDDGTNGGELVITVGSSAFPPSNFTVNYYEYDPAATADHFKGAPLSGAPKDAGKYVLEIELNASAGGSYYATDEYLDFEIKPFTLDMSQVQWGYDDGDGNTVAYNPSLPPEYRLNADGTPYEYELKLVGLPEGDASGDAAAQLLAQMFAESGLASILSYSGNVSSSVTNTGMMTATCTIDSNLLGANFVLGSLPFPDDGHGVATATQGWNIDPKKINTPKNDATHEFNGQTQDILSHTGLDPAGLGVYYNVVGLTKRDEQNNTQSLFTSENCANPSNPTVDEIKAILAGLKDAGRYGITVELIDRNNVKFVENGVVGTLPTYSAQVTVNKLKVQIVGWVGSGDAPWTPNYASSSYPANVVDSRFEDQNGNVVATGDLINHYNEQFTQTIVPSAGNEGNVEIEFIGGADSSKTFIMLDNSNPPDPIVKPSAISQPNAVYTGSPISFMPNGLEALADSGKIALFLVDGDGNETPADKTCFTQTDAGAYKVIAKIVGNYYWDGTSYDKTPVEFNFTIDKAAVAPVWGKDGNGKPVATLPDGYSGLGDAFDYHYYDGDGNEIPEAELKAGQPYSVGVSLKEEFKNNLFLADDTGAEIAGGVSLSEDLYTPPQTGVIGFFTKKFLFGLDMWVWLIIFFVLLLLLILLIILIVRAAKKRKEKRLAAQEKKEEEERKKQELEEERRRKEEEREDERRRKEEEREDERRRREDEREEERRRRSEERMMSGMGMGMGMGMMPQQPVIQPIMPQPAPQPVIQQPAPQPAPQPVVQQPAPQPMAAPQSDSYLRLREYEERLRTMERELQERKIESLVREEGERTRRQLEDAARMRRHEEEMQRLRDLQDMERLQRSDDYYRPYNDAYYAEQDNEELRLLEDQLRQKEIENRLLQERYNNGNYMLPDGSDDDEY